MDLKDVVTGAHKQQRYLLLVVIIGLVILAGVWAALFFNFAAPQVQEKEGDRVIITEMTLAGLRTPQEEREADPTLAQKPRYQAGEPLALRITTAPHVRDTIQISVRLLDKGGGIHELSPSSVEFQPGTSTFCCWRIEEPGTYTLQIFRPEKTITTLPLTIQAVFTQKKSLSP